MCWCFFLSLSHVQGMPLAPNAWRSLVNSSCFGKAFAILPAAFLMVFIWRFLTKRSIFSVHPVDVAQVGCRDVVFWLLAQRLSVNILFSACLAVPDLLERCGRWSSSFSRWSILFTIPSSYTSVLLDLCWWWIMMVIMWLCLSITFHVGKCCVDLMSQSAIYLPRLHHI